MASLAKESLSPLLKSTNVRRRSLEICQRIGNHLLSPNSGQSLNLSCPTSPTTTPSRSDNISPSSASPFKSLAPVFNSIYNEEIKDASQLGSTIATSYHYKRRASDSLWLDALPKEEEKQGVQTRRRCSFQGLLNSFATSIPANNVNCDGANIQEERDGKLSKENTTGTSITCNIIPPTPVRSVETSNNMLTTVQALAYPVDYNSVFVSPNDKSSISGERNNISLDENSNYSDTSQGRKKRRGTHLGSSSSDLENTSPVKSARRCSTELKFDLDDNLLKLLSLKLNLNLNPFELLGKGSFGTVIGGVFQGNEVAVKVLKTTSVQRKESVLGEANAIDLPFHNHIARIIEILYLDQERTFIIMEKMHKGNLLSLLNDHNYKINCSVAINVSKQIALALVFCHREGILHLDVKPQNILVDAQNCCKLSDFGSSKKVTNLNFDESHNNNTLGGTVPYTAPEIFKGSIPTEKCDVYGYAITMWQILTREMPYGDENEHAVIFRVVSQDLRPNKTKDPTDFTGSNYSDLEKKSILKYAEVYGRAWNSNPNQRPSMVEIHTSLIEIQFL